MHLSVWSLHQPRIILRVMVAWLVYCVLERIRKEAVVSSGGMTAFALRNWGISRKPQTDRLLGWYFSFDSGGTRSRRAPFVRRVWLFQIRLEECGNISPDCHGSESFDCDPAALLYSRIPPPCCQWFHECPNVECSGLYYSSLSPGWTGEGQCL